jgi:Skp family chaperone for outer membrane proteins
VTVIFFGVVVATAPANRRAKHDLEEMKAKYNEQYQVLAADYATLATELRDSQAAMQADLAKLAAGVESIEAMMRDVG